MLRKAPGSVKHALKIDGSQGQEKPIRGRAGRVKPGPYEPEPVGDPHARL